MGDRHMIKNHKCRPCGRILLTQKNLVQHINILKCRGEIRCATCSAKMKSEEELIEHNEEEHAPRNKSRNRTQRKQKEIEQQMKMYDLISEKRFYSITKTPMGILHYGSK